MLKRLPKRVLLLSGILGLVVLVSLLLNLRYSSTTAQETTRSNLSEYIKSLYETDSNFYIGFVTPIGDDRGWEVPSRIEDDGTLIGVRDIAEIGTDFICIVERFTGFDEFWCVPFSNIAYINHYPMPSSE